MRRIAVVCASAVWLSLGVIALAHAEDVDVALVLVSDVSRSIDDNEYKLEKDGYASAFANPQVLSAIKGGPNGRIALAYLEFAGNLEVQTVIDWTTIKDQQTAQSFIQRLTAAPRSYAGRTSISAGIDRAVELFSESGLSATRHVIDVCGDGTNNSGRDVSQARDDALKAGATINGLAIINDHPVSWTYAHVQPPGGLPNYYRENVTGGSGSFVVEVHDFSTFGEAITRKLIQEIARGPGTTGTVVTR
jgi:Protein of unknown function (DUF1194)